MKLCFLIVSFIVLFLTMSVEAEEVPRAEHPRPDMQRNNWINLNGYWEFAETDDDNASFLDAGAKFPDRIMVPFCRESELSGLNRKHFVRNVWYRRSFLVPTDWKESRILLHIGACDWKTRVWVNGNLCGEHFGGSAPITCDIARVLKDGENTVVIHAYDDVRTGIQPGGKQSTKPESYGCVYTRTTGIWQTVWLESVGKTYIERFRVYPDVDNRQVKLYAVCRGDLPEGLALQAEALFNGAVVGKASASLNGDNVSLSIPLSVLQLWEPGQPNLYDLKLSLKQGDTIVDSLMSYFGMRKITLEGRKFLINGKAIFHRTVLDQGFYPTGIWTAPSDDELRADIERSMNAGFNGARLHQKVFEPRFLYWADKLGYIVWGEFPDWGFDHNNPAGQLHYINEWREIVERDFNHPAIIGWCPFNETPKEAVPLQRVVFELTRAIDRTRPVLEASGWTHGYPYPMVIDAHDYEQDPVKFKEKWDKVKDNPPKPDSPYADARPVPFFISEYGGIGWNVESGGWGYGNNPKTLEEFYQRLEGLTKAILDNPYIFGFCYTQLTNIEQEQNGIYTYDRKPKFDLERIKAIFSAESAYEKEGK